MIGAMTTLVLFHTSDGKKVVRNVAEEFFEDALGFGPQLACMASGITLSVAMDWTLTQLYHSIAKTPTATIDVKNPLEDIDTPEFRTILRG